MARESTYNLSLSHKSPDHGRDFKLAKIPLLRGSRELETHGLNLFSCNNAVLQDDINKESKE